MSAQHRPGTRSHNAERIFYPAGTTIFKQGDPRDYALIIESGKVRISAVRDGEEQELDMLQVGEIFGETALVSEGERTATATAEEDTEAYIISRNVFSERVAGMDPIVSLLMNLLIERYRAVRIDMPEAVGKTMKASIEQAKERAERGLQPDFNPMGDFARHREKALKELKMEQELRDGIEGGQFHAYLQPVLNLKNSNVEGFETLIRWDHPERGLVSPGDFVPVAERTRLIQALDLIMLEEACRIIPKIIDICGEKKAFVSVNLSGTNFEDEDLVRKIEKILKARNANPQYIKFEITESALIHDPVAAQKILGELKELNVGVALDDFGTGYSSLGYLHQFSIDTLKIDRLFVSQLHLGDKSLDIVRAIMGLANNFKLDVIAEGIERPSEIIALNSVGCSCGQGYLFARPLPEDEALDFMKNSLAA